MILLLLGILVGLGPSLALYFWLRGYGDHDPTYMGLLVSIISSVLCAVLYVRMVKREIPEPMTKKQTTPPVVLGLFAPILATVLVLGLGLAVSALTDGKGLGIQNLVLSSLVGSALRAGLTEELVKFLLFLVIVKRLRPKNVYEYAVMVAGIGFGFTVLEEIIYGGDNVVAALFRLPGFALHMVFGLIMGLYLGLARYQKQRGESGGRETCLALLLPVLFHTVFDAATATNAAFSAEDEYVQFQGALIGLVVVAVAFVLQIVILVLFKKNTEKYCGMAVDSQ